MFLLGKQLEISVFTNTDRCWINNSAHYQLQSFIIKWGFVLQNELCRCNTCRIIRNNCAHGDQLQYLEIKRIYSFLKTPQHSQPWPPTKIGFVCWLCKIQNILPWQIFQTSIFRSYPQQLSKSGFLISCLNLPTKLTKNPIPLWKMSDPNQLCRMKWFYHEIMERFGLKGP